MRERLWTRRMGLAGALMIACGTASPGAAQIAAGVKAGPGAGNFAAADGVGTGWSRGFAGGVFATWRMVEELSFQAEVMYVRKGAKLEFASDNTITSGTLRLDYIELPALLRLDVNLGDVATLHALGGPAVAFRVRCRFTEHPEANASSGSCGALDARTVDFGLVGGVGAGVPVGGATVFLEARYGVGLRTIDEGVALERTNHAFAVVAGFSVPLLPRLGAARAE